MSNGPFLGGAGAAMWTIDGLTQEGRCTGTSFTSGEEPNQTAFWSKLAGIYKIVLTLKYIANWEAKYFSIKIACNGKLAVDRINSKKDQADGNILLPACCNLAN